MGCNALAGGSRAAIQSMLLEYPSLISLMALKESAMRFAILASLLIIAGCGGAADQGPDVAFLTSEQGNAAIIDESVEPYFSLLQTREMSAKTGAEIDGDTLEAQRNSCRQRYQAAVRDFSDQEQAAVRRIVAGAYPYLKEHYPVFAAEPWRFLKVARSIEGGMPHTRGHCIVLSDDVLPGFAIGDAKQPNREGTVLLVHEQTHVLQRLHPALFSPLFVESWGMVRMPSAPELPVEMAKLQVVNPDGVSCVWAYPVMEGGKADLIQPLVLLRGNRAVASMPADFAIVAVSVEKRGDAYVYRLNPNGRPRGAPLAALPSYVDAFMPSEENFHPNEICAELFSHMVVGGLLGDAGEETPCQKGLRGWADVYLGPHAADRVHAPLPRMEGVRPRIAAP
jgi:hypothetical protein